MTVPGDPSSRTTGRPAAAHAFIPPSRFTASSPHERSSSVAFADRAPGPADAHDRLVRAAARRAPVEARERPEPRVRRVTCFPFVRFAHIEKYRRAHRVEILDVRRRHLLALEAAHETFSVRRQASLAAEQVGDVGRSRRHDKHAGGRPHERYPLLQYTTVGRAGSSVVAASASRGSGRSIAPGITPVASTSPGPRDVDERRCRPDSARRSRRAGDGQPGAGFGSRSGRAVNSAIGSARERWPATRGRSRCGRVAPWLRARRAASPTSTTVCSGRSTSPAYSAKRPCRPTLIAPRRWPDGELARLAGVEQHGTVVLRGEHARRGPSPAAATSSSSSGRASRFAVRVEREVRRCHRLALRHHLRRTHPRSCRRARSSCAAAHPCVDDVSVDSCLPHAEPAPWAGKTCVDIRAARAACRATSGTAAARARPRLSPLPAGREEIRAADVADEERVSGEHSVRHRVRVVLVHDDADRLRSVSGGRDDLEADVAETQAVAVFERFNRVVDVHARPVAR